VGKQRKFLVKITCLEFEIRTRDLQVTKQGSLQATASFVTFYEVLHSHGPVRNHMNFVFIFDTRTLLSTDPPGWRREMVSIQPALFPSRHFPIQNSSIILQFDTTWFIFTFIRKEWWNRLGVLCPFAHRDSTQRSFVYRRNNSPNAEKLQYTWTNAVGYSLNRLRSWQDQMYEHCVNI